MHPRLQFYANCKSSNRSIHIEAEPHVMCCETGKEIRKNAQSVDEEGFIAIHLDKCKTEKFFYESKQRKFAALICS